MSGTGWVVNVKNGEFQPDSVFRVAMGEDGVEEVPWSQTGDHVEKSVGYSHDLGGWGLGCSRKGPWVQQLSDLAITLNLTSVRNGDPGRDCLPILKVRPTSGSRPLCTDGGGGGPEPGRLVVET